MHKLVLEVWRSKFNSQFYVHCTYLCWLVCIKGLLFKCSKF